jgi:phosphoadenosine phosphosulfate reductase
MVATGSDRRTRRALAWVAYAQRRFGGRAVFASSFGAEDMVLLDMVAQVRREQRDGIRVFTIDTGRLFPETYDLMQTARDHYGIPIQVVAPDHAEVEALVSRGGPNLFYRSVAERKACCEVRKVHPLGRALAGADAWIVGLRRDQSSDRAEVKAMARDPFHGDIWKLCPLADWSWNDVLQYAERHSVPINALHARGFPSIGCAPCTRAVGPGEDPRSGRWWWENGAKECGLHTVTPGTSPSPPHSMPSPPTTTAPSDAFAWPLPGTGAPKRTSVRRDVLIL